MVWLVIAAGWIFPFRPQVDLSFLPAQMTDISVLPVQPIINAIPPMADAGDIELIHLKRHDIWYKALILVATSLH
jgi:hypothetical protein